MTAKAGFVEAPAVSGSTQVHEGQKATLSWTLSGEFTSAVIEPGAIDARATSARVGAKTKGAVQVLPTRAMAAGKGGDEVTFTLTVTPKTGKPITSTVVIKLVATPDYFEHPTLRLGQTGTNDPPTGSALFEKFVKQVKADLRAVRYLPDGPPPGGDFGGDLNTAVLRFRRAMLRPFRMRAAEVPGTVTRAPGAAPDVAVSAAGPIAQPEAVLEPVSAQQLHDWVAGGLVRPFGRLQKKKLDKAPDAFSIRADAADAWNAITALCDKLELPIQQPYGDTLRPLAVGGASIPGSSSTSRHFVGLGIDFNIHYNQLGYFDCKRNGCFTNRRDPAGTLLTSEKEVQTTHKQHQRYCLEALDATGKVVGLPAKGTGPFWRIWARLDRAAPPTGLPAGVATLVVTASAPHQQVLLGPSPGYKVPAPPADQDPGLSVSRAKMPEGTYVDLSALIESTGAFTRIQAHGDYLDDRVVGAVTRKGTFKAAEFWHWTFCQDGERSFSKAPGSGGGSFSSNVRLVDMCDLIGIPESDLVANGRVPEGQCF